jgi:hypothetical protein
MGKDDKQYLDEELLKLYDYQSKGMVESTLVPNVSLCLSRCLQKSKYILNGLTGI